MKIEIEKDFPQYFKPAYPEEFELFSHFEVTAGIPTVLFAITTWKENGKPNVCFHSWSCFHGDKTAFFAVMGNLYQHTHTYANIQREKCFCINFLPISCYDRLVNTIHKNERDDDEFAAGGFTVSNAKTIHAPTISEAFLTMECTLKEIQDLSGAGITAMVIGQVQHISVEEAYPCHYDVDSEHYQCGYELRPERNPDYAGKQLFHSGLYGYGLVYDPGVAGHLYGTAESNGTLQ